MAELNLLAELNLSAELKLLAKLKLQAELFTPHAEMTASHMYQVAWFDQVPR